MLEALLEVAAGARLDDVLERYGRVSVDTYRNIGADVLPIDTLTVLDGAA